MKFLDKEKEKLYTDAKRTNNKHNWPRCFPHYSQWVEWCRLADLSYVPKSNFCIDCTPEYKNRMLIKGRCEYPKAKIKRRLNGELIGDCGVAPFKRKVFDYPTTGQASANLLSPPGNPVEADPPYSEDLWRD